MSLQPSKFYTKLFKRFCNDDFFEELQGDLEEKFFENVALHGARSAQSTYRKEVLMMIRPSVIKKPKFMRSLLRFSLLQIHLKLTMRNLVRNKTFSAINIFGLAAALSICLFLVNVIYTGTQFDKHHDQLDKLYRVTTHITDKQGLIWDYAGTAGALHDKLDSDIPQIALSTSVNRGLWVRFMKNNESLPAYGLTIDPNFFELFKFNVIEGDPTAIFSAGGGYVITDQLSKRLFGDESAIGKTSTDDIPIVAVIESPKGQSHMQFYILGAKPKTPAKAESDKKKWSDYSSNFTYVRLAPNVSPDQLTPQLASLAADVNEAMNGTYQFTFRLQHINDIMFGDMHRMDFEFVFDKSIVMTLSILMVLVIALASFNYMNLSIARALQRSKEIGIRKIAGSTRRQVAYQFLVETMVFSLFALALAIGIYSYFAPVFPVVMEELDGLFNPSLDLKILLVFVGFSLLVGLIAGLFPALHFAKVSPLKAINSKIKTRSMSLIVLRKILTGFQLTISMFAILFISIGFDQYDQLLAADLGFKRDGLVSFSTKGIDPKLLTAELDKMPEVELYTLSSFIPGANGQRLGRATTETHEDTTLVYRCLADEKFQEVYETHLLQGSHFSADGAPQSIAQGLVNNGLLRRMKIPADSALGKVIEYVDGKQNAVKFEIIGILDDFIRNAFENNDFPLVIEHRPNDPALDRITLQFKSGTVSAALEKIDNVWQKLDEDKQFEPVFVDDAIEASYQFYLGIIKAISFLGVVIIAISILGQIGMALYNAQSRIKEIGIRKVLGANVPQVVRRLLKGTMVALLLATLISTPLAQQLLQGENMPVSGVPVAVTLYSLSRAIFGFMILVCALVILQTWRIANQNPAESLRSE